MSEPKKSLEARKYSDGWLVEVKYTYTNVPTESIKAIIVNNNLMISEHSTDDHILAY